ncbi:hypothetical protein SAMN05216360_13012 [Methylobacterium phyllostachyos]|uniref:Uncharacterized protein n=1 Tax=Methylobacterium phyllostachyos TaxID=582672 RepID=A0A1H0L2A6_9HYPH|nr:hypothetical protein SAMN05216360_13012 [Methylobacterium phyllostachyos]
MSDYSYLSHPVLCFIFEIYLSSISHSILAVYSFCYGRFNNRWGLQQIPQLRLTDSKLIFACLLRIEMLIDYMKPSSAFGYRAVHQINSALYSTGYSASGFPYRHTGRSSDNNTSGQCRAILHRHLARIRQALVTRPFLTAQNAVNSLRREILYLIDLIAGDLVDHLPDHIGLQRTKRTVEHDLKRDVGRQQLVRRQLLHRVVDLTQLHQSLLAVCQPGGHR